MEKELLDEIGITRAIARISHEILERNNGSEDIIILGIPTRGLFLGERIVKNIKEIEGKDVPLGALDPTLYRDDIVTSGVKPLKETQIPVSIDDKIVIIVDDVLFTGRTIRAAMNALMDFGRARAIQLAVLLDRGHRELPIKADYVGKNIPTSRTEEVKVMLEEADKENKVIVKGT